MINPQWLELPMARTALGPWKFVGDMDSSTVYRQWVPLVSATPLTVPIVLKLCMCFLHGMRMWIGDNC